MDRVITCFIDDAFGLKNRGASGSTHICWSATTPIRLDLARSPEILLRSLAGLSRRRSTPDPPTYGTPSGTSTTTTRSPPAPRAVHGGSAAGRRHRRTSRHTRRAADHPTGRPGDHLLDPRRSRPALRIRSAGRRRPRPRPRPTVTFGARDQWSSGRAWKIAPTPSITAPEAAPPRSVAGGSRLHATVRRHGRDDDRVGARSRAGRSPSWMEVTDMNAATLLFSVPSEPPRRCSPGDRFEVVEIAPVWPSSSSPPATTWPTPG